MNNSTVIFEIPKTRFSVVS